MFIYTFAQTLFTHKSIDGSRTCAYMDMTNRTYTQKAITT